MTVVPTGVRGEESSLVARLTLEQKVHLLTGADSWALHGESAVGLRQLITSDGPAGVRGTRFDPSNPSTSLPCPVALAATWDVGLVEEIATALGQEARTKGVDVLLAPTMNIIRTPLSGRGFRMLLGGPAAHLTDRCRLRARRAAGGCRRHGEALRGQRLGDRSAVLRRPNFRGRAEGAVPAAVRSVRWRSRRACL